MVGMMETQSTNQVEIWIPVEFEELFNPVWRNIGFYGGRGSTKSHSIARSLLVQGRDHYERILCAREVQNSIEESSFELLKYLIEYYKLVDYKYTKNEIYNTNTGTEFFFKGLRKGTTQSVKSIEGITKAWVEEAQTVTEESLDILAPTIRRPGSQLIFSYNRLTELDPVHVKYVIKKPPDTYFRMVNYTDILKYGIFPEVLRKEMEHDKATDPEGFTHTWLGEPISQAESAIINRMRALEAMQREIEGDGGYEVGVDVARMGSDRTVFWMRKGMKTTKHQAMIKKRTTEVCDALERFVETKERQEDGTMLDISKEIPLKIDDTGVGGGVTDEMKKRGYNVIPVNFGGVPHNKDKYPNWISEAWFHMAEIMDEIQLPHIPELLMELTSRQWKQDNKAKRRVESKDDYKKRGFRSPDLADACIICYSVPMTPGILGYYRTRATELEEEEKDNEVANAQV